jgi:hypothetical protein
MSSTYLQPSFFMQPEGISRGNGLNDIRTNRLLVQRPVPENTAEQDRSSALRIRVHLSPSVVVLPPSITFLQIVCHILASADMY